MAKNKWLLVSVLSAISSVSGVVAAQPGGAGHFVKLDSNADGVVTSAEFQARVLAHFTQADVDRDGKVTADEAKARLAAHKQQRFNKRDANTNGVLERAEVAKMPAVMFARLDVDRSGGLSQSELSQGLSRAGKCPRRGLTRLPGDADHDGVVTQPEASLGVQKMMQRLDTNSDGKLTPDELGRGRHLSPLARPRARFDHGRRSTAK